MTQWNNGRISHLSTLAKRSLRDKRWFSGRWQQVSENNEQAWHKTAAKIERLACSAGWRRQSAGDKRPARNSSAMQPELR